MSHSPQPYLRGYLVLVIDCGDLERSAQFWTSVLGYDRASPPSGPYQGLVPAGGQVTEILLQQARGGQGRKEPAAPGSADPRSQSRGRTCRWAGSAAADQLAGHGGGLALAHTRQPGRKRILRAAAADRVLGTSAIVLVKPPSSQTYSRHDRTLWCGRQPHRYTACRPAQ